MSHEELIREAMPAYQTNRQDQYTVEDYRALPDDTRAELIDGWMTVMEAPSVEHQELITELITEFKLFIRSTGGSCKVIPAPLDVRLDCDEKTVVQPDIVVSCDREKRKNQEIMGAPDMCIEVVSASTRNRDYDLKMTKYRNAGVREYWIIDLKRDAVTCYHYESSDAPAIYTFHDQIPVHIFDSRLKIDFSAVKRRLDSQH